MDESPIASTIDIAFQIKAKHADLLDAATKCGGIRQLAEHIGVSYSEVCTWVSLTVAPRFDSQKSKRDWEMIGSKLFLLTGKTLRELWPEAVRSEDFLSLPKTVENRRTVDVRDLALMQSERLRLHSPEECAEASEMKEQLLAGLKRLPSRYREIIQSRYGIDRPEVTLEELSKSINISRERVRQLEQKAIELLRDRVVDVGE